MRVLVFVALCASASGFRFSTSVNVQQHRRRLVAATVPSRVALFMDAGKDDDDTPLPVPSITSLAYAAIVFLQSKDTYDSPVVREWVSKGFPLDSIQGVLPSILGNGILVGYGLFQLGKMAGIGKTNYYGDLEGPEVGSLSQQAATWALAGEVPTRSADGAYEVATFAGGCFWGTELHYQRIPGVIDTCVGYTQGRVDKPSYGQVCGGTTGHTEGIMMTYDPEVVSYGELCDKLMRTIDSTALNRVGNDIGTQYRHGLYPATDAQAEEADRAIERETQRKQRAFGARAGKVVTEVKKAKVFYPAEKYHQRKLQKGGQSAEKECTVAVRCYG